VSSYTGGQGNCVEVADAARTVMVREVASQPLVAGCVPTKRVKHRIQIQLKQPQKEKTGAARFGWRQVSAGRAWAYIEHLTGAERPI